MKISIVIPTNRASYSAMARALELSELDPDRFELIVRDNSEDARKRELLGRIDSPTLRYFSVPNRGAIENAVEALRLASGDFVLFLADDDWVSAKGLTQLHDLAQQHARDESVSSLAGTYLVETTAGTGFIRYSGIDSLDATERVAGYIQANAPNVLYYSAVRRPLLKFSMEFVASLPYKFSFHDNLVVLLHLALGRTLQVDRVVYHYDQTEWETLEGTLAKDRAWYVKAGLPIEVDRLHWLICGLEGALTLNSQLLADRRGLDRKQLSDLWFATMFSRFKHWDRELGWSDTPVNQSAKRLKDKWIAQPEINPHELLFDVCDLFEIADKDSAQRYFDFWSSV